MILRHRGGTKRLLSLGLAAGLLFALAGDGGRAQSYTITGTDPLEVLELKIKPNVVVVLDSSGSMAETLSQGCSEVQKMATWNTPDCPIATYPSPMLCPMITVTECLPTSYLAGDHPESKLGKAKSALQEVFAKNETKVSFSFASYTQDKKKPSWMGSPETVTTLTMPNPNSADYYGRRDFRFIYYTSDALSAELQAAYPQADPVSDDVQVAQAAGDTRTRGLQAWQDIRPTNWGAGGSTAYLYWKEGTGVADCAPDWSGTVVCTDSLAPVSASCAVTITTGFYRTGADLAAELQTRMNTCGSNDYAVAYDPGTGTFGFSRTAGSADFEMYWSPTCYSQSSCPNNYHPTWRTYRPSIGPALGGYYLFDADNTQPSFTFTDVDGDGTPETKLDAQPVSTVVAYSLAHRKAATTAGGCADNDPLNEACYVEPRDLDGDGVAESSVTFYNLYAARFFNGETIVSDSAGNVCDILAPTAATTAVQPGPDGMAGTADDTPVVWVRKVSSCGDSFGQDVPFIYAGIASNARDGRNNTTGSSSPDGLVDRGMPFSSDPYGNTNGCGGIQYRADLRPCDSGCLQYDTQIAPWLEMEVPLTATNELVPSYGSTGSPNLYRETTNGIYRDQTFVWTSGLNGGLRASGATPIAKTLQDIKGTFTNWWSTAGPVDCPAPDGTGGTTDPFALHDQPAAPTIVVFVSDGNDTCADNNEDLAALEAALAAEQLYAPVDILADPGTASSVRTYMIAFGEGADPTRLNWIAWGGSGLGQGRLDLGMPDVPVSGAGWSVGGSTTQEIDDNLAPLRAQCTTCGDALIARDGDELGRTLQRIIDQGATSGNFSASRQSITDSVYEYVYLAGLGFGATDPDSRYKALAPTRFISTFSLPGFRGELTAWQDRDANGTLEEPGDVAWRAGEKLLALVQAGFVGCQEADNLCRFDEISGLSGIQRRIYTTDGNGVYGPAPGGWASNPAALASAATSGAVLSDRLELWPPHNRVTPNGEFDDELGIPTDLATLQSVFGACMGEDGATLPPGCLAADPVPEATLEARQMILAFMAGADPAGARGTPRRDANGNILYRPRSWVLAESTQATPAVLGPPLSSEPEVFTAEYRVFRDGRDSNGDPLSAGMVERGCGLRDPADDATIQPVMTQVFLPANDMLHAFRGGPCYGGSCSLDEEGKELWGFVPYDLLPALRERFVQEPQGREDHVYMLARGVRYADVFFPKAVTDTEWCGAGDGTGLEGIWRRVVFIGRGPGGKFLSALDVTAPGDLQTAADQAPGPVPLWSRGNPDQAEATRERPGATDNHNASDTSAYAYMGETWSLPVVALVDSQNGNYSASPRDPNRKVTHALFTGSGYGNDTACFTGGICEGTTFYTLDALTGDVITTADVGQRAALVPVTLDDPDRWYNAIVANPAGFNPRAYSIIETVHPSASKVTRVYVGDLHGRLWKFLTASPDIQIPLANLSTTVNPGDPAGLAPQPVATAAGLIGLPPYQGNVDLVEPYIYVTSGNDRRGMGPFKMFGFRDTGGDTDTQLGAPVDNPDDPVKCPSPCNVQTYNGNAGSELLFAREYDEGAPLGTCGNPIPGNVFRGTVQPATSFEPCDPPTPSCTLAMGRVFFGGTRLNLPGTEYAPPTPIACGSGTYPCRSSFDSIVYALGAETGLAAYDLNSAGDDAYRIYRDQRISAVSMASDPAQGGGSRVLIDEGQLSGAAPTAPPPAGVPPTVTTSGTGSVVMSRDPNFPPPAVRIGSAVCQ